ncbi:unnamed protein product [Acanthoscelides obtectus]|uniref:Uncharacterized protein n=1 Tax=Acanthoscelides obtectus TaxID=200917 RepID=A0A9P0QCE7_ACAOB|nr:unnamed protein product [Acanthoscelides obtectus]CAK1682615.1 hypothetical protein AOBTE_LOCUS33731 [Acanthoscelides obtectus]
MATIVGEPQASSSKPAKKVKFYIPDDDDDDDDLVLLPRVVVPHQQGILHKLLRPTAQGETPKKKWYHKFAQFFTRKREASTDNRK